MNLSNNCSLWLSLQIEMENLKNDEATVVLPPPPPVVPPNVIPQKAVSVKRLPMARRGVGSKGQSVSLLTNHFKVAVSRTDGYFCHYSVTIFTICSVL